MANNVKTPIELLYSKTAGAVPTIDDSFGHGSLAINEADRKLFFRTADDKLGTVQLDPYAVKQLADAVIAAEADKQALVYVAADKKWKNITLTSDYISDFTAAVNKVVASTLKIAADATAGELDLKNDTLKFISGENVKVTLADKVFTFAVDMTKVQAKSANLDNLSKLSKEGLVYRKEDGTFAETTITGTNGVSVTVTPVNGTVTVELPASGVKAGTYTKVTVNDRGVISAGANPTTVDGYGITDAVKTTGGTMTGELHLSYDPEGASDDAAVTKKWAQSVALGYVHHVAATCGANTNIAGTYAAGSNAEFPGVGATFTTTVTAIGGHTVKVGDRVLLIGQTDKKQNGIYAVTTVGANVVLTRADDMDGDPKISYNNASFLVADGSLKGCVYAVTNKGVITFGTDNIEFVQVFTPTAVSAGDGIAVSGSKVSVKVGGNTAIIGGNVQVTSGSGNNGKVLTAGTDNAAATYKDVKEVIGVLPIANGGTGAKTAAAARANILPTGVKGDILYFDGTAWTKLAKGANNSILSVDASGNVVWATKISAGTF